MCRSSQRMQAAYDSAKRVITKGDASHRHSAEHAASECDGTNRKTAHSRQETQSYATKTQQSNGNPAQRHHSDRPAADRDDANGHFPYGDYADGNAGLPGRQV